MTKYELNREKHKNGEYKPEEAFDQTRISNNTEYNLMILSVLFVIVPAIIVAVIGFLLRVNLLAVSFFLLIGTAMYLGYYRFNHNHSSFMMSVLKIRYASRRKFCYLEYDGVVNSKLSKEMNENSRRRAVHMSMPEEIEGMMKKSGIYKLHQKAFDMFLKDYRKLGLIEDHTNPLFRED